jgi:PAS domain S-box-containing protein
MVFEMEAEKFAAMVICDEMGMITGWDENATTMFHWQRHQAIGKPVAIIIPPEQRETHRHSFQKMIDEHRIPNRVAPLALEAITRDKERMTVWITLKGWDESAKDSKVGISVEALKVLKPKIFVSARIVKRFPIADETVELHQPSAKDKPKPEEPT